MDLLDLARSVIDIGLWAVAFVTASTAAWVIWKSLRWEDSSSRMGWTVAAFVVVLFVMGGLVRPALEYPGQPSHPRHPAPTPSSPYGG